MSYIMKDEVFSPLTPRKCTVLNGNFVFSLHVLDLCNVFQECILGIKQDIPVHLCVSPAYFIAAIFFFGGEGGWEMLPKIFLCLMI